MYSSVLAMGYRVGMWSALMLEANVWMTVNAVTWRDLRAISRVSSIKPCALTAIGLKQIGVTYV